MSLRASEVIEIASEQKGLTTKPAAQLVEGKGRENPGNMRPHHAAALRAWHPRARASPVVPPMDLTLAGERGGQGESVGATN
jgi:hypothetical protein